MIFFSLKNDAQVVGTKIHCFENIIQLYRPIFWPQVEKNKYDIFFFSLIFLVQNQEKKVYICQKKLLTE